MSDGNDGWVRLKINATPLPAQLHTWETDADGETWLVVYELRDGKSVELRRTNARDVTL
ncbi:MAG TPA: hypothetical protein VMZ53_03885 [Kofleriaceae bacterium]|nr:hypothetical protein [Kofleriaceae bacterium]